MCHIKEAAFCIMAAWAAEKDQTGKPSPLKKRSSSFRVRL
jgi:hypothetical protein